MRSDPETACRDCRHFLNRPMALEAALPGLRTLSSAHAAVRSEDGLCGVHDRYVAADYGCGAYSAAFGHSSGARGHSASTSTRQS
jgi:hypothetical protein